MGSGNHLLPEDLHVAYVGETGIEVVGGIAVLPEF